MNWYGNVINRIMENSKQPIPVVGMGATECMWSDAHAYEVIAVKDARHCTVRRMKAVNKGGFASNDWELSHDENGRVVNLFLTKNGRWVERHPDRSYGSKFCLGYANEYYDYSF